MVLLIFMTSTGSGEDGTLSSTKEFAQPETLTISAGRRYENCELNIINGSTGVSILRFLARGALQQQQVSIHKPHETKNKILPTSLE